VLTSDVHGVEFWPHVRRWRKPSWHFFSWDDAAAIQWVLRGSHSSEWRRVSASSTLSCFNHWFKLKQPVSHSQHFIFLFSYEWAEKASDTLHWTCLWTNTLALLGPFVSYEEKLSWTRPLKSISKDILGQISSLKEIQFQTLELKCESSIKTVQLTKSV